MFDYTGYECHCCGKKFTEEDDIVMCPECGTPYHRECWLKNGSCTNTELHEKNISWKQDMESKGRTASDLSCKGCGNKLRDDQLFCDKCGMATEYYFKTNAVKRENSNMSGNTTADYSDLFNERKENDRANPSQGFDQAVYPFMINFSDRLCGFNPDEQYGDNLTTKDIGDFVGSNTHYYLPKFKLMKTGHFRLSMNISALFFPELYFANRKMYLAALLILIIRLAIDLPATAMSMQMILQEPSMAQTFIQAFPALSEAVSRIAQANFDTEAFNLLYNISSLLNWAAIFIFGSLSNYFYYKHTIKKAAKIKAQAISDGSSVSRRLSECGGTSSVSLAVFIGLSIAAKYAVMAAILLII